MTGRKNVGSDQAIAFGPFRLIPLQQQLLEGDTRVRLGSRALDILTLLVERAGELVTKSELVARVSWSGGSAVRARPSDFCFRNMRASTLTLAGRPRLPDVRRRCRTSRNIGSGGPRHGRIRQ